MPVEEAYAIENLVNKVKQTNDPVEEDKKIKS